MKWVYGFGIVVLLLLTGCTVRVEKCLPVGQPVCMGNILGNAEMEDMAAGVEADLAEMMPGERFDVYVEDGCVKTCRFGEAS